MHRKISLPTSPALLEFSKHPVNTTWRAAISRRYWPHVEDTRRAARVLAAADRATATERNFGASFLPAAGDHGVQLLSVAETFSPATSGEVRAGRDEPQRSSVRGRRGRDSGLRRAIATPARPRHPHPAYSAARAARTATIPPPPHCPVQPT